MKMFSRILLIIIFMTLLGLLLSCGSQVEDYNDKCVKELNEMKSPVILIGMENSPFGHSIVLKDSLGEIFAFGNMSYLARALGESHNIGDTIK